MTGRKIHQLNIRVDEERFKAIYDVSCKTNQNPSSFCSQIVSQWMDYYYCKMRRGDVILSQPVLKMLLDSLEKNKMDSIADFMASHIAKEIKMQEGDVNYSVLADHILKWNTINHLPMSITQKTNHNTNESDIFVSRHNLGNNWSELQCKTYKKVFELIGKTTISSEYDVDTFSFEVIKERR